MSVGGNRKCAVLFQQLQLGGQATPDLCNGSRADLPVDGDPNLAARIRVFRVTGLII
jgi:hypothetical protein